MLVTSARWQLALHRASSWLRVYFTIRPSVDPPICRYTDSHSNAFGLIAGNRLLPFFVMLAFSLIIRSCQLMSSHSIRDISPRGLMPHHKVSTLYGIRLISFAK